MMCSSVQKYTNLNNANSNWGSRSKLNKTSCFVFVLAVVTFYYYLSSSPKFEHEGSTSNSQLSRTTANRTKTVEFKSDIRLPVWTWICIKNQCQKHYFAKNQTKQSLDTCNMLCESSMMWPQPAHVINIGKSAVAITPEIISLLITNSTSIEVMDLLKKAFKITKDYIKKLVRPQKLHITKYEKINKVIVSVNIFEDRTTKLKLKTKEKYSLKIKKVDNNVVVTIIANSFFGARHGFTTFSHNIWYEPLASTLLLRNDVVINDKPKFQYRGLLLDTARNFYPIKDLYRTIDAMAATKLNTFHWHISDSQSFPLKLDSVPELAKYGAYGPKEVYTTDDVRSLVKYARIRGVRILIEIDTPSHVGKAWSWGPQAGLGVLVHCVEQSPWNVLCGEPPCGQLNPKNPNVYKILRKIYTEIINMTEVDDIFHLGGDEVSKKCWDVIHEEPYIELWLNFTLVAMQQLKAANKGVIPKLTLIWNSDLTNQYSQKLIENKFAFQMWSSFELNAKAPVVISHLNSWYLDCGFGSWTGNENSHCSYNSWQKMYEFRPWVFSDMKWQVVGGEVCQWSEQLNPGGLDTRVWPRAAAVAERLWYDQIDMVTPDVYLRLDAHIARLAVHGVKSAPLWPKWCVLNPDKCIT